MNNRHGAQGILDTASKGQLEGEFGTHRDDDVVAQILEKGSIIETEVRFPSWKVLVGKDIALTVD